MSRTGLSSNQHCTTRRPWRFRRCPACATVRAASEYAVVTFGPSWSTHGVMLRRCPQCDWVDETRQFTVVRELHGQERRGGRHERP